MDRELLLRVDDDGERRVAEDLALQAREVRRGIAARWRGEACWRSDSLRQVRCLRQ